MKHSDKLLCVLAFAATFAAGVSGQILSRAYGQSAAGGVICFSYQRDCIHYAKVSNSGCGAIGSPTCNWQEVIAKCSIGDQTFFVEGMDLMLYPKNSYLVGKARLQCHLIPPFGADR